VTRDWRKLPYWQTSATIDKSLHEIGRELERRGITTVRTTRTSSPLAVVIEWEQEVRGVAVVVQFEVKLEDHELYDFTKNQAEGVQRQAVRLLYHTVKNILAAVDAGIITLDEAFLANIQTWKEGLPITVGDLFLEEIERRGQLGPTITAALPKRTGESQ